MTNFVKKNVQEIYELPANVKFCKKCVVSNQRPRIVFDDEGGCSACRFAEKKKNVIYVFQIIILKNKIKNI